MELSRSFSAFSFLMEVSLLVYMTEWLVVSLECCDSVMSMWSSSMVMNDL